ncbi:MAG: hypothetical protein AAF682_05920 [Planctomycetota bacterium]
MRIQAALAFLAALPLASCVSTKTLADPTLLIHSPEGTELGVATEWGAVFLGRFARGGEVDVTAWFADGPSLENSVVEPIGGGLYTAETNIRLPRIEVTFRAPQQGEPVRVFGRSGGDVWSIPSEVRRDPRVEGILLRPRGGLTGAPEQVGAGVYVGEDELSYQLLGLVSGRIRIVDDNGRGVDYVTVIGPKDLWRLVAHNRDLQQKPRWVYREDVL